MYRHAVLLALMGVCSCGSGTGDTGSLDAGSTDATSIPSVQFQLDRSPGDEGDTVEGLQIEVQVSLDAEATQPVTVQLAATGGTAVEGADFAFVDATRSVTIDPGRRSGSIAIQIEHDGDAENDETIELSLVSAAGAVIGGQTRHTVTISASLLPRVQFTRTQSSGVEAETRPAIALTLDKASLGDLVVSYALLPGATATPIEDHDLADGTVIIPAGSKSATIPVTIVDDDLHEDTEDFRIALTTRLGAVVGADKTHKYVILNDDSPPAVAFALPAGLAAEAGVATIDVLLTKPSAMTLSVDYAVVSDASSATGGVDFTLANGTVTFPPGTTMAPIQVAIRPDDVHELNETITVALTRATIATLSQGDSHVLTIADDDGTEGVVAVGFGAAISTALETGTTFIEVRLSRTTGATVTVDYDVVVEASSATGGGVDFTLARGTQTFPPGSISAPIRLEIRPDGLDEYNETITLVLSRPTNATLSRIESHVMTIFDDDARPVAGFTVAGGGLVVNEGDAGSAEYPFRVDLSPPSGRPVALIVFFGGTATLGEDYEIIPGNLPIVFQPGQTSKDIRVAVRGDVVQEGLEAVSVNLDAVNATLSSSFAFLDIVNDD